MSSWIRSGGVVIAGLVILDTGWTWLDPVVSPTIVAIIVRGSWGPLRDSLAPSLAAVPPGIDPDAVRSRLEGLVGVTALHDLPIWAMSTTETCLTAHLAMPGSRPDDAFLMDAAGGIRECFGLGHTTLQVETSGDTACVLAPARIVRATPGGWGAPRRNGDTPCTPEESLIDQSSENAGTDDASHVLLVEDDDGLRMLVTRLLREAGYRVTGCRNAVEFWRLLPAGGVDLVLLDVMLPGASGLDLLRALRAKSMVPVIMVSARNEEADRVLGLELGADDYVAKPFGRPELLARIRAVLRRASLAPSSPSAPASEVLAFSGWTLDMRSRSLLDPEGAAVDLSGAEYDLLLVFLEHPGRVLGRETILELSRGRLGSPSDRSVDTLVSRLRRKLEPPEGHPPVIKTVRGAGYMLASKVGRA